MKPLLKNQLIKLVALIAIVVLLILSFYSYFSYEANYPSTDNAYIHADIIQITPEISGTITSVLVKNDQPVKKGDLLLTIDPQPFQIALDQAIASKATILQNTQGEEDALISAKALVKEREAQLAIQKKNQQRLKLLLQKKMLSQAQVDEANTQVKVANATLEQAKSHLEQLTKILGETGDANKQVQVAEARVATARLNLDHTQIKAPADGYISQLNLNKGAVVNAGNPLFALIEADTFWVTANFKETILERIKPGQTVTIKLDIYPKHTFKGVVESLSRGSTTAFSLFPPEDATGNWIKVTQRFPVRIKILNPNPEFPLRVGASTRVMVDTTLK